MAFKTSSIFLAVVAVVLLSASGKVKAQSAEAIQILNQVNQVRARAGLGSLCLVSNLMNSAENHSRDQANNHRMSHSGSNGSSFMVI